MGMKTIISLLLITIFATACRKNDLPHQPLPDLSLDKLQIVESDLPDNRYFDLTFTDSVTGYVVAEGTVSKTLDGGKHWATQILKDGCHLKKIKFINTDIGFILGALGSENFLFTTKNAGGSWSADKLDFNGTINDFNFTSDNQGFLTGDGYFAKTNDGGYSWTRINSDNSINFSAISFKNSTTGYVNMFQKKYLVTNNGGTTWAEHENSNIQFSTNIIFAGGNTYVGSNRNSLVSLLGNEKIPVSTSINLFHYFNDKKSIGIGSHYETGYFPYGDIYITNNNWATSEHKQFNTTEAMYFTAMAPMNSRK